MSKTVAKGVITALTIAFTRRYVRDKVALFFTFIFPLIFLFVFGGIFSNDSGPSYKLAVINNSDTPFAEQFVGNLSKQEIFKLDTDSDFATAEEKLGRGELDAILELPADYGQLNAKNQPSGELVLKYDQADQQLAQALSGGLQLVLDQINSQFVEVNPPLTLKLATIQTANLSQFDYTFAGLLGFSILGLGIFSMANGFTSDKKNGALRRLRVAPIKASHVITATAINRILIGLVTVATMFVLAVLVFDFNMRGDYISFMLMTIFGTICMFGFGMAIAGWARDDNQAAPIANLVAFPMMFLSGTFFPRFMMPEWLQTVSDYLPLTPIIDGLRLITTEGKTILELGPQLAIIAAWTIFIYIIAFRTFRWE